MAEIDNDKLAEAIAQKVVNRFNVLNMELISKLEILLPSACGDAELKKWNDDILRPGVNAFMTQAMARPDVEIVFIAEATLPEAAEGIIEGTIARLSGAYPRRDFVFTLRWSDRPRRVARVEGIGEYNLEIEKETDLDVEGLEEILDDLQITLGIHKDNIEMIPSLAQAAAAKGCHKMSSRLLRLSEWNPQDSTRYQDMLEKLHEVYKGGNLWLYLFDQFLVDAKCEGAGWGCAAGRARACLLPNGRQIPCFQFLEKPELAEKCAIGDRDKPFANQEGRCIFSHVAPPAKECLSCEISRLCYGGCYLDRYEGNGTQFGRNELFCELLKRQIHFLNGIKNSPLRLRVSGTE